MSDRKTLRRHINLVAAQLRRHPNRPAPVTRGMEFAFETDQDHSDAVSAALMIMGQKNPDGTLNKGLIQWKVYHQDVWRKSFSRHHGKTVNQIIEETYPNG